MEERGGPLRTARRIVLLLLAATLLGSAACGAAPASSSTGNGAPPSSLSKAVAYSACMRAHGVVKYPDPTGTGQIAKESPAQLGVSGPRYETAARACQNLAPVTSQGRAQSEVRQEWSGMLAFARCMRAKGVPNWPDPTPYPQYPDEPTFLMPSSLHPTAQVVAKMYECQRLVPHNDVGGHIDNQSWQSVSLEMGSTH